MEKRRVPQEGRGTYARPYAVDPAATMRERSHDARGGKRKGDGIPYYFFPASMASPFLHATILIFGADTISFDSILNVGFFTMNVHTSSQRRYVCKWPCTPDKDYKYEGRGREGAYLVKICWRDGRSSGGGSGRKGTSPSSMRWKSRGMPGNTQSLPSRRTTGYNANRMMAARAEEERRVELRASA